MRKKSTIYLLYWLIGLLLLLLTACGSDKVIPSMDVSSEITILSTETRVSASATARVLLPTTAATTTPSKPSRTPTLTLHPTRTPVIASSPEDIIGVWQGIENRDGMYHQFNADGTCRIAQVRSALETNPNVICNYWFEDSNFFIEEVEVRGVPVCGFPGVYQVQMLGGGEILFIKVDDKCTGRVRTTTQLHRYVP